MLSATEPAAAVQSVLTPASVAAEPTQAEPATTPTAAAESEDGRACPAADPAAAPTATPTIASDNTPPAAAAGPATAASAADDAASASFASSAQPPADGGNEPDAALDASSTTAVDSPGGENAAAAARSGEVEAAETSTAAAAEAGAGAAGADAADGEQADAVPAAAPAAAPAGGDDGVDTARAHIDGTGSPVADISTPGDAIASALQSKTVNAPAASDDSAEARSSTRHMGKRPASGQSTADADVPPPKRSKLAELEARVRRAIPEFTEVDELLEENEQLVVDIDRHQQDKSKSKGKQKDHLVQAEKKIQQLNRNTHQIVALYKKLAQAAAKNGKKQSG